MERICICGNPLTGRSDKKTCSPACRQAASRRNRKPVPKKVAKRVAKRVAKPAYGAFEMALDEIEERGLTEEYRNSVYVADPEKFLARRR